MSNLNIQENSDSSSNNTIIEAEKTEESPDNVALCPPIPGGQVCTIVHSLGMESASELILSTGTEASATPPQTSSRKYKYGSQVIHETDCTCPYCYIRKSTKKKMSFSVNAANMVRQNTNAKCSMSKPAVCSAEVTACLTPMVNLKVKAKKNQEE